MFKINWERERFKDPKWAKWGEVPPYMGQDIVVRRASHWNYPNNIWDYLLVGTVPTLFWGRLGLSQLCLGLLACWHCLSPQNIYLKSHIHLFDIVAHRFLMAHFKLNALHWVLFQMLSFLIYKHSKTIVWVSNLAILDPKSW